MKVLQVVTDTDRRGAQIFAHELAPVLGGGSWPVTTVALARGVVEPPLPFEVLGKRRLGAATLHALRGRTRAADVVVGFGSSTLPACSFASMGGGVPFVYRSIGDLRYWVNTPAKLLRVRAALRRASQVVVLWPAAAETLVNRFQVPKERVAVIPRAVDPGHFTSLGPASREQCRRDLRIPAAVPLAVVVGSLRPEKGVDRAIDVAAAIPDLHLAVAGDGELASYLHNLARRRAPGRVHFLGQVRDTRVVYGASDVLLLPSRSEGVPGVVIEAGMSGRPAVATDVGGTGSVILDGVTGRLVPEGEHHALVEATAAVLARTEPMGRAAREEYVERFALAAVGQQWTRLLTAVVERGRRRPASASGREA